MWVIVFLPSIGTYSNNQNRTSVVDLRQLESAVSPFPPPPTPPSPPPPPCLDVGDNDACD